MVLLALKIIAAVGTLLTGFVSLIWPRSITRFTGVEPVGGRGVTEIRAVFGGAFIGLGAVCLLLGEAAYRTLGVMYLAIAVVRAVSMVTDKSVVQSNIISLLVELAFGMVLVL